MLLPKMFALVLALAVLGTSLWMIVLGGRFQEVERRAYAGDRRPWWFVAAALAFVALYALTLFGFVTAPERSWAAWLLVVVIPVGVALKGALVVFNPKGQAAVTAIAGDAAWRKVALSRLALVPVFLVLAYYA
jgi:hypothetical protein